MIKRFIKGNKRAIITAFKWTSVIFTSIVLLILSAGLINNQKPEPGLFIAVVLSASLGFPIFVVALGFLRWYRDSSVTGRNFSSFPFSQLDFNWISKKYHYNNHRIKSGPELEKELIDFGKLILGENIEPSDYERL